METASNEVLSQSENGKGGRPPVLTEVQRQKVRNMKADKDYKGKRRYSNYAIGRLMGVSEATIRRVKPKLRTYIKDDGTDW